MRPADAASRVPERVVGRLPDDLFAPQSLRFWPNREGLVTAKPYLDAQGRAGWQGGDGEPLLHRWLVHPAAGLSKVQGADAKAPVVAVAKDSGKTYSWSAHACDMAAVNQAANKEWTLTTLYGKNVDVEKPPTMKFAHGKLSIFGGINRLSGSYALVGDSVTMGQLVSTKMAGDPALMELESNFAKALVSADGYRVSGNLLEISSKGTVVAAFRSVE